MPDNIARNILNAALETKQQAIEAYQRDVDFAKEILQTARREEVELLDALDLIDKEAKNAG